MTKTLSIATKRRILADRENNVPVTALAKKYKRSEPTIYKIIADMRAENNSSVSLANQALAKSNGHSSFEAKLKAFSDSVRRDHPEIAGANIDFIKGEAEYSKVEQHKVRLPGE